MSTCPREDELLDSLGRGYVGAELQSHVESCASCTELRTVAGSLLDDRTTAMLEAPIPSAGTMWWRMQLRHRQEAATTARRSLLIGQAVTLLIAISVVLALFGRSLLSHVSVPVLVALAMCLVAAPIMTAVALRSADSRKGERFRHKT